MEALLEIRNIECLYGPVLAIKGVSMTVGEGSVVTLLGANGAGKSTILRTISGFIQPEKGEILFMGENIAGLNPQQVVRRGIGHVPEGREVFDELTVWENLRMGAYLRKDRHAVEEDFGMVFDYFPVLKQRMRQRAGWLSGGEQQMLAIGRALLGRPRLLTMDEPSLGLSPLLVREIFQIIRRINDVEKKTVLLVEQNARMALETAAYGYILETGRIVLCDAAHELMQNQDVQEFYLGARKKSIRGDKRWKRKKLWR
jgi:branched-chain amino acid transport system ATP-binding protein